MEISRVETEREIAGFDGGGGVPAEIVEIVGAIVRAVRIETEENPARVPPTRVTGLGGFTGFGGGATGAGFDGGGAFLDACCFGAGCGYWAVGK